VVPHFCIASVCSISGFPACLSRQQQQRSVEVNAVGCPAVKSRARPSGVVEVQILCLAALPVYALTGEFNPLMRLISVSAVAGLAYLAALWTLEKDTFIKMLEMVGFDGLMRVEDKSTRN
jgi:hypothetical protein